MLEEILELRFEVFSWLSNALSLLPKRIILPVAFAPSLRCKASFERYSTLISPVTYVPLKHEVSNVRKIVGFNERTAIHNAPG